MSVVGFASSTRQPHGRGAEPAFSGSSRGRIRTFVKRVKVSRPAWLDDPGSFPTQTLPGSERDGRELHRGTSDTGEVGSVSDRVAEIRHSALGMIGGGIGSHYPRLTR